MNSRTVEQVKEWPTRPFSGGYGGVHELAAAEFSGVVSANGAWLFVLNGHVIGVADGTLEAFEDADGTAHEAPADALPLLFAMQERGGEKRGQYYSERTPLSEVHETLSAGGFTGYVELSENVLSGDYYVVYYGGNAKYAAFLGEAERLLTGEEARERAADEVGLYDVIAVDLSILDVPEPAGGASVGGAAATDGDEDDTADDRPIDDATAAATSPTPTADPGEQTGDDLDLESTLGRESGEPTDAAPEERTPDEAAPTPERPADATDSEGSPEESSPADANGTDGGDSTDEAVAASLEEIALDDEEAETPDTAESGTDASAPETEAGSVPSAVRDAEGEEPTVPATDDASGGEEVADAAVGRGDDEASGEGSELDDLFAGPTESSEPAFAGASAEGSADGPDVDAVAELESRVEELEAERDRLDARREELEAERDRLRARVEELETEIAASGPPDDHEQVTPEAALRATDLFVRYQSRGAETLDAAHDGAANREAVRSNLDLEHHTRFDADATAVGDEPYESFLPTTLEHRLVTWLVADLLYEIRETGHVESLRPLYDALPEIDRADLYGEIEIEDGEAVAFDVVCRDRLGNPLLAVDLHESREPATDAEMDALLENAARVAEVHDEFACAFLVAASFFDPSALEVATETTASGGLFGGSKRESFVKLSRKRGFHLCLVEARDRRFHVTMPEL